MPNIHTDYWAKQTLIASLKNELASRAIRTMGPRSPFWNCTICGVGHLTPVEFKHEPECLLADARLPSALWPQGRGAEARLIAAAPDLLEALRAMIETSGRPMREKWMNDSAFYHAQAVDAQARAALAKATGETT